jgi:hypothetical protein
VDGLLRTEAADARKEEEPWDSDAAADRVKATNDTGKARTKGSTRDEAISNRSRSPKPSPDPDPQMEWNAADRRFLRSIRISAD